MLLSRGGKFLTCPGVTCGCCVLQLDAVGLLGHLSQAVGGAVDMGVAPLFAGPYKLRFSLWGFTWNKGRIEPAPSLQYATVWAAPDISNTLSKSVGVMTAPSLEPHEQEITTWLTPCGGPTWRCSRRPISWSVMMHRDREGVCRSVPMVAGC